MSIPQFQVPDLTEANAAIAKAFSHLQGLKMYSEADFNKALAEAFDDGFTACAHEHMKQDKDPAHPITRVNPYRG